MAKHPWRLQGEIAVGEIDPIVTIFVGFERAVLDDKGDPTGEIFVEQNTADPVMLPLSQAVTALAAGTVGEMSKKGKAHGNPV